MALAPPEQRNQDATCYVGGIDDEISDALMWELFVQAGPVVSIHMPRDRITNQHQGYGFIEFLNEEDADYATKIMNMVKLCGKPIRVNKASSDKKDVDVGANLFIGNLDPEVDEKMLYDTFSAFGVIPRPPKVQRDPETGNSKGFGFVSFDSFEAADAAIEAMHSRYFANRTINVMYAYKKDLKGERHGSAAERLLAAQLPGKSTTTKPNRFYADAPGGSQPPRGAADGNAPPPPHVSNGGPPGVAPGAVPNGMNPARAAQMGFMNPGRAAQMGGPPPPAGPNHFRGPPGGPPGGPPQGPPAPFRGRPPAPFGHGPPHAGMPPHPFGRFGPPGHQQFGAMPGPPRPFGNMPPGPPMGFGRGGPPAPLGGQAPAPPQFQQR